MDALYEVRDGDSKALIMIAPMSTIRKVFDLSSAAVTRVEREQTEIRERVVGASTLYFEYRRPRWFDGKFVWISRR